jgi:diguanylate cyclase (GGDEF)-like protein
MNEERKRIPIEVEDLLVFHTIAHALASSNDVDQILETILAQMESFVPAEFWSMLILDRDADELYCAIASNPQTDWSTLRLSPREGVSGWVMQNGRTLILPEDDARLADGSEFSRLDPNFKIRSVIAMPLIGRNGTLGLIQLVNPDAARMNDATIAMLHILSDYAAIAIENARDVAHIRHLTITDEVTGLHNVRHLFERFERELEETLTEGSPFSLAFLDIDFFKDVNDQYGHLNGSEVLGKVGELLARQMGDLRMCFRYGGDEFALFLPGINNDKAGEKMNTLLNELASTLFEMRDGTELELTASIGISTAPADGTTVKELIATADARMYLAKAHGRNRVEC